METDKVMRQMTQDLRESFEHIHMQCWKSEKRCIKCQRDPEKALEDSLKYQESVRYNKFREKIFRW